jgi:hypothetical protein
LRLVVVVGVIGGLTSVERGIEALLACGDLGGLSLNVRPAENMRLRSLTKTCLGELLDCLSLVQLLSSVQLWLSYIFVAILVHCKMYSSKRPSSDLLFDNVLIDSVLGCAVISTRYIFGMSIE